MVLSGCWRRHPGRVRLEWREEWELTGLGESQAHPGQRASWAGGLAEGGCRGIRRGRGRQLEQEVGAGVHVCVSHM